MTASCANSYNQQTANVESYATQHMHVYSGPSMHISAITRKGKGKGKRKRKRKRDDDSSEDNTERSAKRKPTAHTRSHSILSFSDLPTDVVDMIMRSGALTIADLFAFAATCVSARTSAMRALRYLPGPSFAFVCNTISAGVLASRLRRMNFTETGASFAIDDVPHRIHHFDYDVYVRGCRRTTFTATPTLSAHRPRIFETKSHDARFQRDNHHVVTVLVLDFDGNLFSCGPYILCRSHATQLANNPISAVVQGSNGIRIAITLDSLGHLQPSISIDDAMNIGYGRIVCVPLARPIPCDDTHTPFDCMVGSVRRTCNVFGPYHRHRHSHRHRHRHRTHDTINDISVHLKRALLSFMPYARVNPPTVHLDKERVVCTDCDFYFVQSDATCQ